MRIHARSVSSCVASRNKRAPTGCFTGRVYPNNRQPLPLLETEAARFECRATPPGYRGSSEGALWSIGNGGFYYSPSVNDCNGVYLNFGVASLYPSSAYHRACGFQLRCLSE